MGKQSASSAKVVRLRRSNASVLRNVAAEVFDESIDASRVDHYMRSPDRLMLLAVFEGVVVAQAAAVVHRHPDRQADLFVDDVAVAPAFRRRGLANAMLRELFAIGKKMGCKEAWVLTEVENTAARELYESADSAPARHVVMYDFDFEPVD